MNWNDLRFFLWVARQGGLTGAARVLGVSQSTVSRRIEALETAMNSRLFERQPDGYRLTEAGQDMLKRAELIEANLLELESDFSGRDARPAGKVAISSIETLVQDLILPALPEFNRLYPDVVLDVSAVAGRASLPDREADLALRLSRPEQGPYTIRRIGSVGFGIYASQHYLDHHPVLETEIEAGHVLGHAYCGWPRDLDFTMPAQAIRRWICGDPVIRLDTVSSHLAAASRGLGLTVLSHLMAAREPRLRPVRPDLFHELVDLWLVVPNDLICVSRIRATCDFLTDLIRQEKRKLESRPSIISR